MRNFFAIMTCLALCSCESNLAPKQELTTIQKRSHFFRIDGWPYQKSSLFTRFPAELTSGVIATPFVYFATPFFVDYKADKVEVGKALYESERIIMEKPRLCRLPGRRLPVPGHGDRGALLLRQSRRQADAQGGRPHPGLGVG